MDAIQAVYWHQGMFMQPQHFQLADLAQQQQLRPIVESGLPHFWGVGQLELEPVTLAGSTIMVRRASLLFQDGTAVTWPGNAAIAARGFDQAWLSGGQSMQIYLGLRRQSLQQANVSLVASEAEAAQAPSRFAALADPAPMPDLLSDGPAAQVRTLLHVVKIFFEHELPDLGEYLLIPVACLLRVEEGVVLDRQYIPPAYQLDGAESLAFMLKDMRDELAGRARQLEEYKCPRERQGEFDQNELMLLLALRSLNRSVAMLFHLTELPQVHPWHIYGLLRQLVGELSSFSEQVDMFGAFDNGNGLPAYDHVNLQHCFDQVRQRVRRLLNGITIGPDYLVALQPDGEAWRAELPKRFFEQRNRFYLVLRNLADPDSQRDSFLSEARLAAADDITGLILHALPGLELIHMDSAPSGIPRRSHSLYFRIEQISQLWDNVERYGEISLHWPHAAAELKAEIIVLRR